MMLQKISVLGKIWEPQGARRSNEVCLQKNLFQLCQPTLVFSVFPMAKRNNEDIKIAVLAGLASTERTNGIDTRLVPASLYGLSQGFLQQLKARV
jgi:hypothetical protein